MPSIPTLRASAMAAVSLVAIGACADDSTGAGGSPQGSNQSSTQASAATTTSSVSASTTSTSGAGGSATSCSGKLGPAGDTDYILDFGGDTRNYRVHTPPGYDASAATSLVVVMHGYLENGDQIETISQMTPAADARGVLLVYPEGQQTSWNAGSCCASSQSSGVDDVGFIDAMLDEISSRYCVDDKRIYAAGFSNGGMLSHRLACERADRFAAIGPVAGTLALANCAPSRPVPMMVFHGTADFVVPYNGGFTGPLSVPATIDFWTNHNGCGSSKTVTYDQGSAQCKTYGACTDNAAVTLCTLSGAGHQWPGGMSAGAGGLINMDIAASEAMLDFFALHTLP